VTHADERRGEGVDEPVTDEWPDTAAEDEKE
jgi:hypothetical protein